MKEKKIPPMPNEVWYFELEPNHVALKVYQDKIRSNLRVIELLLQKDVKYEVSVIYPAPWEIQPHIEERRVAWLDYYRQIIGLKKHYENRVRLIPLDSLSGLDEGLKKYKPNEVGAIKIRLTDLDLFDLFIDLERNAIVEGREVFNEKTLGRPSEVELASIIKYLEYDGACLNKCIDASNGNYKYNGEEKTKLNKNSDCINDVDGVYELLKVLINLLLSTHRELEKKYYSEINLKAELNVAMEAVNEAYTVLLNK